MRKEIILNPEEYDKMIRIMAKSAVALDSYTLRAQKEAEKRHNLKCHIMDSEFVDENMKELFTLLVYLDGEIRGDLIKFLGDEYFDKFANEDITSVLYEDGPEF